MSKAPKLTMKQAKFVKGIAEGKPPTVSAQESYDVKSYGTAASIASENLNKPNVKAAIDAEMAKQGITMEKIIAPVSRALDSTVKVRLEDGEVIDTGQADLDMQLKGHDRAMRLMSFGVKKEDGATINNYGNLLLEQRSKYE